MTYSDFSQKNKILTNIICLIFSILLFTQCIGGIFSVEKIDENDRLLYKENDTLIFRSELNIDSIFVKQAGRSAISEGEGERLYEVYRSNCVQIDSSAYNISYGVEVFREHYKLYLISSASSFSEWDDIGSAVDSIQIGDYLINNIIVNSCSRNRNGNDTSYISIFKFNRKYGLVEYTIDDGETFQLHEKSIELLNNRLK